MDSPKLMFCGDEAGGDHGNRSPDDETEVFFGEVSECERKKAAKYKRRTVVFQPEFREKNDLMRRTMDQLQILSLHENKTCDELHLEHNQEQGTGPLMDAASNGHILSHLVENEDIKRSPQIKKFLANDNDTNSLNTCSKLSESLSNECESSRNNGACSENAQSQRSNFKNNRTSTGDSGTESPTASDPCGDDTVNKPEESEHPLLEQHEPLSILPAQLDRLMKSTLNDSAVSLTDDLENQTHDTSSASGDCYSIDDECSENESMPSHTANHTDHEDAHILMNQLNRKETTVNIFSTPTKPTLSDSQLYASASSPLLNRGANPEHHTTSSPQLILDDINTVCDSGVLYHNVFGYMVQSPQNFTATSTIPKVASLASSGTQEVPNVVYGINESPASTPVKHVTSRHEYSSKTHAKSSSTPCAFLPVTTATHGDDDPSDVSIVTLGSVLDDSLLDTSRRTIRFSGGGDTDSDNSLQECHLVPQMENSVCLSDAEGFHDNPAKRFSKSPLSAFSRPGLTFTERQFSPTLTVRASPPKEDDPSSDYHDNCVVSPTSVSPSSPRRSRNRNVKCLSLDIHGGKQMTSPRRVSRKCPVPESPECLSNVNVTLMLSAPPPASPRRGNKVKRLAPPRSPRPSLDDEHKMSGSVFERLYGVQSTPGDSEIKASTPRASSAKRAPIANKAETLRRAHSASKVNTVSKSANTTNTPNKSSRPTATQSRRNLSASRSTNKTPMRQTGASRTANTPSSSNKDRGDRGSAGGAKGCIKTTGTINRQAICQATKPTNKTNTTPGRTTTSVSRKTPTKTTPGASSHVKRPNTPGNVTPAKKTTTPKALSTSSTSRKPTPNPPKQHGTTPPSSVSRKGTPRHEKPLSLIQNDTACCPDSPQVIRNGTPRYVDSPPVFHKGTPRYPDTGKVKGHREDLETDPLPLFDLDESLDDCDLSALDDSILLQEKRVELERLHLEKIKLQKQHANRQKTDAAKSPTVAKSHAGRSPLVPTTADNLPPRGHYSNKQVLSLSEPELDAITLVYTLCNSQQQAKLVTKARAANVVRQTSVESKPASKLQWSEQLETDIDNTHSPPPLESPSSDERRRSILTIRTPGSPFPYHDQPMSPIVVTKGSRKMVQ